jgi:hypothetical protein
MGAIKEFQLGNFQIAGAPSNRRIATAVKGCSYLGYVPQM